MVKALVALVGVVRSAWLVEAAGAGLVVWGVHGTAGPAGAAIAAGVGLLLKAYELDVDRGDQ